MNIKWMVKQLLKKIGEASGLGVLFDKIETSKILTARILINQMKQRGVVNKLTDVEFQVFSQFGDDGIIQYLIQQVKIQPEEEIFVEFGVENYEESNTKFLLMNNNWRGLVIDGGIEHVEYIKRRPYYWRHDLTAVCAFIDAENINGLIDGNGFSGEIGLLSIDIDGNDYWVWEKIEAVNPVIVIVEYNSTFGPYRAVTIPYDAKFYRSAAHYSNLYWGASMKALDNLAHKKGYVLVGANSAGNNAYFVRADRIGDLCPVEVVDAYSVSKFRESRDKDGNLSLMSGSDRIKVIEKLPVYDVDRKCIMPIHDILNTCS